MAGTNFYNFVPAFLYVETNTKIKNINSLVANSCFLFLSI